MKYVRAESETGDRTGDKTGDTTGDRTGERTGDKSVAQIMRGLINLGCHSSPPRGSVSLDPRLNLYLQ